MGQPHLSCWLDSEKATVTHLQPIILFPAEVVNRSAFATLTDQYSHSSKAVQSKMYRLRNYLDLFLAQEAWHLLWIALWA